MVLSTMEVMSQGRGWQGFLETRHAETHAMVTVAPGFQVARATPQATTPQGTLLRGRTAVQFSEITDLLFREKTHQNDW